eukprot:5560499-Prymnesium_polylepis.1
MHPSICVHCIARSSDTLDARKRSVFCPHQRPGTRQGHVSVTRHAAAVLTIRINTRVHRTIVDRAAPQPDPKSDERAAAAHAQESPVRSSARAAPLRNITHPACWGITRQPLTASAPNCKPRASEADGSNCKC